MDEGLGRRIDLLKELSPRQLQALRLACQGKNNVEIGRLMPDRSNPNGISEGRVRQLLRACYTSLGIPQPPSYSPTRPIQLQAYCQALPQLDQEGWTPPVVSPAEEDARIRALVPVGFDDEEPEFIEGEVIAEKTAQRPPWTSPTGQDLFGPVVPQPIIRPINRLVIALVVVIVVLAGAVGYLWRDRQTPLVATQAASVFPTPNLTQEARIAAAVSFASTAQAAPTAVPTATPNATQQALVAAALAFQATAQAVLTNQPTSTPAGGVAVTATTPTPAPISPTSALTATALPAPTPSAAAHAEDVLYKADWSQGPDRWPISGQWKWSNGHLLADGTAADSITAPFEAPVSDYAVEATIRVLPAGGSTTNPFGVIARSALTTTNPGAHMGYAAGVYCSCPLRTTIMRGTVNNNNDHLDSNDFDPGTREHIYRFELSGYTLSLLVDNNPRTVTQDGRTLSGGTTGLFSWKAQIEVSSFKVTTLQ